MYLERKSQLVAQLVNLEKKAKGRVTRAALRAGAKIIRKQCHADAPKKSGAMAKAIRVRAGRRDRKSISVLVTLGKRFFTGETFYGGMIEFGYRKVPIFRTVTGQILSRRRGTEPTTVMPGTHFMSKAFDKSEGAARTAIESTLAAEIFKEAVKTS